MRWLLTLWKEIREAEKGYRTNPGWRRDLIGFRFAPVLRFQIALATMRMNRPAPPQTTEEYLRDPMPNAAWKARCAEYERVGNMRRQLVKWKRKRI